MKNKWKILFILCFACLVVSNIFWVYSSIDSGVTLTYKHVVIDEQNNTIKTLGSLIVLGSQDYSKKDILHLLRQAEPDAFIVEEFDEIIFQGIKFRFEQDRLISIAK